VLTTPRQLRHFLLRAGYVLALFVLMYTAGQATFFRQQISTVGEVARFGALMFTLYAAVQLVLVLFFAPLFAASRIAQEKDRQTLILLLMTDLYDREMVVGKLLASLLPVGVLIGISAPVLALLSMLGGVSASQIGWSLALSGATAFAAGSWGNLVAFWREKTFQTLAISVLGLLLFLAAVEGVSAVLPPAARDWVRCLDPFRGLALIVDPLGSRPDALTGDVPAWPYVGAMLVLGVVLNVVAIARLRVWNPPRNVFEATKPVAEGVSTRAASRTPWHNPVLWREICTRAYGRRVFLIKFAYLVLFGLVAAGVWSGRAAGTTSIMGMIGPEGAAFVALGFVSLLFVNAQSVTSITTERDARTLELLLVTDVTSREFVFGKLLGALNNAREVLLLPLVGLTWVAAEGVVSWENYVYVVIGFVVLVAFSSMLGMHAGLTFDNSRAAIANSLGTMFFLFLGVFICLLLIIEARASFAMQLPSFLVFILGGSIGLWASLTHKTPAPALGLAAFLLPFMTFYSITSYLLGSTLGICVVVTLTYGFTTIAMLVPALGEFDVALGRTTLGPGN
jgi:ABC-type transport system involved in multi-copper enzyme maturation permease subunit